MKREDLEKLENCFHLAICVCDPIDFQQRQKSLLHCIANCLLEELRDIEKSENQKEKEQ